MTRAHELVSRCALLILLTCRFCYAQNGQFLPEIDTHLKVNSAFRAYLEVKGDREGGVPQQFVMGPSIQLYLKPLIKLKDVAAFDLDDSKHKILVLEIGYRYIDPPDAPSKNRMLAAATSNIPLIRGIHLSDRNRTDLDWENGNFTWRYRNKLTVQRTFSILSFHLKRIWEKRLAILL